MKYNLDRFSSGFSFKSPTHVRRNRIHRTWQNQDTTSLPSTSLTGTTCPPPCSSIRALENSAAMASDLSRDTNGSFEPTMCSEGMPRGIFPANKAIASGSVGGNPPAKMAILKASGREAQSIEAIHVPWDAAEMRQHKCNLIRERQQVCIFVLA